LLPELAFLNDPDVNPGFTGAFLFASTTARSSPALLGWNCGYAFFSNVGEPDCRYNAIPSLFVLFTNVPFLFQIMFGVLYAASPEVFPGMHRGTGNGLTATSARVFSVLARSPPSWNRHFPPA
jgi:hypothetical protein